MGIRYVIAGESQCDLFAETCLVADYLAQKLPNFCYERIEKPVTEWMPWLQKLNQKNKWHHTCSPIVWKELLMTGSKPVYIGNASEFLEYCYSYYKFDVYFSPLRFEYLSDNFGQFQKKVKQEAIALERLDNPVTLENPSANKVTICISGAGNPLALFIISGLLDLKQNVSKIYIYDEECSQTLMEFIEHECNYVGNEYLGKLVKYVDKIGVALTSSDLLIILDYIPFQSTYSIGKWLYENKKLMENIAIKINATATPKLYVVLPNLGPACYNATVIANLVTKINKNNVVVATSDIGLEMAPVAAEITGVPLRNMFCPPVWGFVGINHLADIQTTIHRYDTFHPYERYVKVKNSTLCIGTSTPEMRTMQYLMFFDETLWKKVADRKKKDTERRVSFHKAVALLTLIKIWLFDPNPNYIVSLGIQCNGSFGLTFNGVFSQPACLLNGEWRPASNYMMPRDPQVKISYLQEIAEIVMTLKKADLRQVVTYTPCTCKRKQYIKKLL
ncbi:putative malate dehydrogenase 1B [Melitaea cinxia]|uniref:putative malate dehydrogenase 1B n=1 Tax=Melitaea cinxia TaxID=113334 RepID=UPI001E272CBD|nr:putative malate dehydrogenase 1B [Melitaea cinxia]